MAYVRRDRCIEAHRHNDGLVAQAACQRCQPEWHAKFGQGSLELRLGGAFGKLGPRRGSRERRGCLVDGGQIDAERGPGTRRGPGRNPAAILLQNAVDQPGNCAQWRMGLNLSKSAA